MRPERSATVFMSLSPRPERLTSSTLSFVIVAASLPKEKILLVNLSGRGDKDMNTVAERSGLKFFCRPECDPARRA